MWKKSADKDESQPLASLASPTEASRKRSGPAVIGPSIRIKGDISGEEDLVVEGTIEGEISLKNNNVVIGRNGKAKADVYGKTIRVEGQVEGNLFGSEAVVLHASGNVSGNITAPKVTLENGATFKGSIDMASASGSGSSSSASGSGSSSSAPYPTTAPAPRAQGVPGNRR